MASKQTRRPKCFFLFFRYDFCLASQCHQLQVASFQHQKPSSGKQVLAVLRNQPQDAYPPGEYNVAIQQQVHTRFWVDNFLVKHLSLFLMNFHQKSWNPIGELFITHIQLCSRDRFTSSGCSRVPILHPFVRPGNQPACLLPGFLGYSCFLQLF